MISDTTLAIRISSDLDLLKRDKRLVLSPESLNPVVFASSLSVAWVNLSVIFNF